jgi:hypothetical protein
MGRLLELKKNILLTQAVITDMAKSIFKVLKKKGGGDGTCQYSTLLSLGEGGEEKGEILNRRLYQKSKISAVYQS